MRYVLTKQIYKMLRSKGVPLVCKLCGVPLHLGDEVESKPSKYGEWRIRKGKKYWHSRRKLYHVECYDESYAEIPNSEENKSRWLYDAELDVWLLEFEETMLTFGASYDNNPSRTIYKNGGSICSKCQLQFTYEETLQLYFIGHTNKNRGIPRCPKCGHSLRTRPTSGLKYKTSFWNRLYDHLNCDDE